MEVIILVLIGVVGLCVGSFLNVLIYRTPAGMNIVFPPSHCPNCKAKLKWFDNIPVLSYIILGGKCRYCKKKISGRYIFVELANCILWLVCAIIFGKTSIFFTLLALVFCSMLIVIAFIDIERKIILDRYLLVLLGLGVLACCFSSDIYFVERIIGFCVGAGVMLFFYVFSYLLFKKEGMGIADIKLLAVCGLFLGWKLILLALFIGAILGAIMLLILQTIRKEKGKEYPFAPFLVCGMLVALFVGNDLLGLYLQILS